jgi:hypothetical protein
MLSVAVFPRSDYFSDFTIKNTAIAKLVSAQAPRQTEHPEKIWHMVKKFPKSNKVIAYAIACWRAGGKI